MIQNHLAASRALEALYFYAELRGQRTESNPNTLAVALLADLRHCAASNNPEMRFDFDGALAAARIAFHDATEG